MGFAAQFANILLLLLQQSISNYFINLSKTVLKNLNGVTEPHKTYTSGWYQRWMVSQVDGIRGGWYHLNLSIFQKRE